MVVVTVTVPVVVAVVMRVEVAVDSSVDVAVLSMVVVAVTVGVVAGVVVGVTVAVDVAVVVGVVIRRTTKLELAASKAGNVTRLPVPYKCTWSVAVVPSAKSALASAKTVTEPLRLSRRCDLHGAAQGYGLPAPY